MFLSFNGSIALLINTLYSFIITKNNKIPVGCCVCQRAVEGGCLGRRCWSVIRSILWGSWLMIAIGGHGAQTSQTYGESVVSSCWSPCVAIESTLCFCEIRIHCVPVTYQLSLINIFSHLADIMYIQLAIMSQNIKTIS